VTDGKFFIAFLSVKNMFGTKKNFGVKPILSLIYFRIRAVKFRPQNFGRISFDLGEISPNQQILRLNNGRNSPKSEEIRPKFLRANLNCVDIYCVYAESKNNVS
jgi:hypothetical protein